MTLRQWFVCPVCWNVIIAYQKSIAASAAIQQWWTKSISSRFQKLKLVETEPMYLSPFSRSGKSKRQRAEILSDLDFLVSDLERSPPTPIFHVEQKTGPGSIDEMSEFQLDVNDFNDIVGVVNNTRIPAYMIHVQAVQDYDFPTRKTVIRGMWWTDVFSLIDHQKRVSTRRGEDKEAIYYSPEAFKPIESFGSEIENANYAKLADRIASGKIFMVD